jgi:bifunctional UDP-N-acetylglucosamine pyrophosphorylase/glucosamine-1-phosphate N-acetyltransferase
MAYVRERQPMARAPLLTIVLAAGKGTRMKSALPKVLHRIGHLSLVGHVLATARAAGTDKLAVVIGPDMESVRAEVETRAPGTHVAMQHDQRGTADAVLAASNMLAGHAGDVLVLYGDTPLIEAATLRRLIRALDDGAAIAVLGFEAVDPTGYGRLLTTPDGTLTAIREEKDATPQERAIRYCNSGVMAFRCANLLALLDRITCDNAKGEYYLTDAVAIAHADSLRVVVVPAGEEEVLGVNSRDQLALAEAVFQRRARQRLMQDGVTMIDPATVWLAHDTSIGRDVTIEPNVFFGPGVTVDDNVIIHANCHLVGVRVRSGAEIGPFARFRPGADIGRNVHIGNFVEVKNVTLGTGAKANHLAYLGDGSVGAGTNIGAGTIFCNYDGFNKHRTTVGDGAFIGSNSSLVAPVNIGDGAYIGSGSVITKDVAPHDLALERNEQQVRPGWAARFRAMMGRRKSARTS